MLFEDALRQIRQYEKLGVQAAIFPAFSLDGYLTIAWGTNSVFEVQTLTGLVLRTQTYEQVEVGSRMVSVYVPGLVRNSQWVVKVLVGDTFKVPEA